MAKGKDAHPRKDFAAIGQRGLKALELAMAHKAVIEPRLPAGLLDGLNADLQELGVVVTTTQVTRDVSRVATLTQEEALAQGYKMVTAVRTAVIKAKAPAVIRKAYGVGTRTSPKMVSHIQAAIRLIIDRAKEQP